MRETLRRLAQSGKTVFVSSHLLSEVRQMADVVGIIAAGRLVREGTMSEMLRGEGVVRMRVRPEDAARATELLANVGTTEPVAEGQRQAGWVSVRTTPDGAEQLNRTLAEAGIYASEIHVGSDLEELFLTLTSGSAGSDRDGTFQSIGTIGAEKGDQA
jgi:ABC-2 type transport system ATP-binding protein